MISRQVNGYVDNLSKIKNSLSCDWVFEKTLVNFEENMKIFLYLSWLKITATNNSSSIFSGNLVWLIAFVWVSTNSTLATEVLVLCLVKIYQLCEYLFGIGFKIIIQMYQKYSQKRSINSIFFLSILLLNQKMGCCYFLLFLFYDYIELKDIIALSESLKGNTINHFITF